MARWVPNGGPTGGEGSVEKRNTAFLDCSRIRKTTTTEAGCGMPCHVVLPVFFLPNVALGGGVGESQSHGEPSSQPLVEGATKRAGCPASKQAGSPWISTMARRQRTHRLRLAGRDGTLLTASNACCRLLWQPIAMMCYHIRLSPHSPVRPGQTRRDETGLDQTSGPTGKLASCPPKLRCCSLCAIHACKCHHTRSQTEPSVERPRHMGGSPPKQAPREREPSSS